MWIGRGVDGEESDVVARDSTTGMDPDQATCWMEVLDAGMGELPSSLMTMMSRPRELPTPKLRYFRRSYQLQSLEIYSDVVVAVVLGDVRDVSVGSPLCAGAVFVCAFAWCLVR